MKNKVSLTLMEQLIMVLVFALAAALCLQVFAEARQISRQTACWDELVLAAQNVAEELKHRGDLVSDCPYAVEIRREETEIDGFAKATVTVSCECGEAYSLTVGWQEVTP